MIPQDKITASLDALYEKIDFEGREAIRNRREMIDPVLNHLEQDKRLELTLLIHIGGTVAGSLKAFMDEMRKLEPDQYFYPESDLHVTVLDLISADQNFERNRLVIDESLELAKSAISGLPPFCIDFNGIITSNAAVLAKGYYTGGLRNLRDRLRSIAMEQGFDLRERYQSISAHSTIIRYKSALQNREKFLTTLEKYKRFNIGGLKVNELELVIHDWYNRRREAIGKFYLGQV